MNLYYKAHLVNLLEFPEIDIDIVDICVLDFISNHYRKQKGRSYMVLSKKQYWLKLKTAYLIESNPYLKLKAGKTLDSRLKRLEDLGFLDRNPELSMKVRVSCYKMGYLHSLIFVSESLTPVDIKNVRQFLSKRLSNSELPK